MLEKNVTKSIDTYSDRVYDEAIVTQSDRKELNMPTAKEIGARLRTLRGSLSRKKVSEICGISRSALTMYETGARVPRDEVKIKLADLYSKSVEDIFFK